LVEKTVEDRMLRICKEKEELAKEYLSKNRSSLDKIDAGRILGIK